MWFYYSDKGEELMPLEVFLLFTLLRLRLKLRRRLKFRIRVRV